MQELKMPILIALHGCGPVMISPFMVGDYKLIF